MMETVRPRLPTRQSFDPTDAQFTPAVSVRVESHANNQNESYCGEPGIRATNPCALCGRDGLRHLFRSPLMKLAWSILCPLLVVFPAIRATADSLPSGTTATSIISVLATADAHQGQLTLSWVGDSDSVGFLVERSTDGGVNFTQIANVLYPMTSFRDSGLTVQTTYFYRVRAYNSVGISGYSGIAGAMASQAPAAGSIMMNLNILRPAGLTTNVLTCATVQCSTNAIQFVDMTGCERCDTKNFSLSIVAASTNRAGFYRLRLSEQ